ncbi:MAG: 50S ribosomal protein L17 [Gemmataceae bacterium]
MRHLKAGRKLGRNASHRLALLRNLARALILSETGRIITTVAKAKEARPFIEKLITLAKKGTLHARRQAIAKLGPVANTLVGRDEDGEPLRNRNNRDLTIVRKLFDEIGPRYHDRNGGYTRVIKRPQRRLGDAGHTAILELLREGEIKVRARTAAPQVRQLDEEESAALPTTPKPSPTPETSSPAEATPAASGETPSGTADESQAKPQEKQ